MYGQIQNRQPCGNTTSQAYSNSSSHLTQYKNIFWALIYTFSLYLFYKFSCLIFFKNWTNAWRISKSESMHVSTISVVGIGSLFYLNFYLVIILQWNMYLHKDENWKEERKNPTQKTWNVLIRSARIAS